MSEYGIITGSYRIMKTQLPLIIEDASKQLSFPMRAMLNDLLEELRQSNSKIKTIEQQVTRPDFKLLWDKAIKAECLIRKSGSDLIKTRGYKMT